MSDFQQRAGPQSTGFGRDAYQRPNQRWVCGHWPEGTPCPLGPTASGRCTAVCKPYQAVDESGKPVKGRYYCANHADLEGRCHAGPLENGACGQFPSQCQPRSWTHPRTKHEYWLCTRGRCQDGPLPDGSCSKPFTECIPRRTLMAKRRIATLAGLGLALGLVLLMMAIPGRETLIAPGDLTSAHNAVDRSTQSPLGEGEIRCAACHQAGSGKLLDVVHGAFASRPDLAQTKLCLKCHAQLAQHHLDPHTTSPSFLSGITQRIKEGALAGDDMAVDIVQSLGLAAGKKSGELACSVCHQEHHGRLHDLKHMTDRQCQVCHANPFHGFDKEHPAFTNYPYTRRVRIYFDHQSHYGRHFQEFARFQPDYNVRQDCTTCHQMNPDGGLMLVRSFEQTCGDCHAEQITDDSLPGVAFFALPALDAPALRKKASLANWPEVDPTLMTPRSQLPPLMRLLLSTDKTFVDAEKKIEGIDLENLSNASDQQLQAAKEYAQSIINVFQQWSKPGQKQHEEQLTNRLASVLQPQSTTSPPGATPPFPIEAWRLARTIPWRSLFLEAQKQWFSGPQKPASSSADGESKVEPSTAVQVSGGWYLENSDMSIRYRPVSHDDPVFRNWLEFCAQVSSNRAGAASNESADESTETLIKHFTSLAAPLHQAHSVGRCTKCHTIDANNDGSIVIHWQTQKPSLERRPFTRFSHRPHLDLQVCGDCHVLISPKASDPPRIFRPEFIHFDGAANLKPHLFHSDFAELNQRDCATCHKPGGVRHSCLTCHRYHVSP